MCYTHHCNASVAKMWTKTFLNYIVYSFFIIYLDIARYIIFNNNFFVLIMYFYIFMAFVGAYIRLIIHYNFGSKQIKNIIFFFLFTYSYIDQDHDKCII